MDTLDLYSDVDRHLRLARANTDPAIAGVLLRRMAMLLALASAKHNMRTREEPLDSPPAQNGGRTSPIGSSGLRRNAAELPPHIRIPAVTPGNPE